MRKIDIHNHVLPGLYDGASEEKESMRMLIDEQMDSNKISGKVLNKVNYVKVNGKGYDVTGYQSDDGFACALSSYNKFRRILGHIDEQNEVKIQGLGALFF